MYQANCDKKFTNKRAPPPCIRILLMSLCVKSERNNETRIHLFHHSPSNYQIIKLYFSIDSISVLQPKSFVNQRKVDTSYITVLHCTTRTQCKSVRHREVYAVGLRYHGVPCSRCADGAGAVPSSGVPVSLA